MVLALNWKEGAAFEGVCQQMRDHSPSSRSKFRSPGSKVRGGRGGGMKDCLLSSGEQKNVCVHVCNRESLEVKFDRMIEGWKQRD